MHIAVVQTHLEQDASGGWLKGPVFTNAEDNVVGFLEATEENWDELPPKSIIEVICIGKMEAKGMEWLEFETFRASSWFHRHCPNCYDNKWNCLLGPDWTFTFYNVLWIEWEDGIAYRKSIGKIWADY